MKYLMMYLLVINIYSVAIMYSDKNKSRKGKWRIPEKRIFITALLFGSPGVLIGMHCFRHKTKHWKFVIGIPLILAAQLCLAYFLYKFLN